jgi:multidrug efflux pump subunit AcrA (membrane-fusion protein)
MKFLPWLIAGISLAGLFLSRLTIPSFSSAPSKAETPAVQPIRPEAPPARKEGPEPAMLLFPDVKGRTQCVPGHKCLIAPVPLHPVVEVLVVPGQRVRKGQPLVKIDDDEAQADVRAKVAALESVRITLKEYRRWAPSLEKLFANGYLPEKTLHTALMERKKGGSG